MKKKQRILTPDELVEIYQKQKSGYSVSRIMKEMGLSNSIYTAIYRLEYYMKTGENTDYIPYQKALNILRTSNAGEGRVQIEPQLPPPTDNLAKLEKAFMDFQKTIVDIIVDESEKRSLTIVMKKEPELKELKEKYEKELLKMQEILVSAHNASMVGMLRKAWGLQNK